MEQFFNSEEHGLVIFKDKREQQHATLCQPRDIQVLDPTGLDRKATHALQEEIAVDIRINQGASEIGVRKNLKFS